MNLKIGGNSVGKVMYGGQEFGGAAKLEPDTILYLTDILNGDGEKNFEGVHLKNTTKNWSNIDGIHLQVYYNDLSGKLIDDHIYSDDFKSLDTGKKYDMSNHISTTVSRSIIDGEYRLNASTSDPVKGYRFIVKAL